VEGKTITHLCQAQNLTQGFTYSAVLRYNVTVLAPTTTAAITTAAPTTAPPLVSNCMNLTGTWVATNPTAELRLYIPDDNSGKVYGFMTNGTDKYATEMIGRTDLRNYGYVGISGIWPVVMGITGMSGECHRCSGLEVIIFESLWRSITDSMTCGDGGTPRPHTAFTFYRLLAAPAEDENFMIYNPSKAITGKIFGEHRMKELEYTGII